MKEIQQALKEAEPVDSLKLLVDSWRSEGINKDRVTRRLEEFFDAMHGNRYTELDEEHILEVIDYVAAWDEE